MGTVRNTPGVSIDRLKSLVPALNHRRLQEAQRFMQTAYGDKVYELMDMTLQDHAFQVTQLLAEFCPDEDAIIASLLQHALTMPDCSLQQIKDQFGRNVRDIVSRIHLLSHLHTSDWRKSVEDMKIMLVSVSDDIRVLLIALAIQSYFMQALKSVWPEYRSRLCRQSLII